MTEDALVHLVNSFNDLGSAQPVPVSNLPHDSHYAGLAVRNNGTPSASYAPRPASLIPETVATLGKDERLYVAPASAPVPKPKGEKR